MSAAPIIIDLKESTDVVMISEPANRIQRNAVKRVKMLLKSFVESGKPDKNRNEQENKWIQNRVHNAILVNGSRGSGKTTFIRNLFEDISKKIMKILGNLKFLILSTPPLSRVRRTLSSQSSPRS